MGFKILIGAARPVGEAASLSGLLVLEPLRHAGCGRFAPFCSHRALTSLRSPFGLSYGQSISTSFRFATRACVRARSLGIPALMFAASRLTPFGLPSGSLSRSARCLAAALAPAPSYPQSLRHLRTHRAGLQPLPSWVCRRSIAPSYVAASSGRFRRSPSSRCPVAPSSDRYGGCGRVGAHVSACGGGEAGHTPAAAHSVLFWLFAPRESLRSRG